MFMRGGYLAVMQPNHHLACSEGWVYVHRLKAEEKLGRPLSDTECVHHIDGNKLNNNINNLMVFKTIADHSAYHMGADIRMEGDVYVALPNKNNICPICEKYKDNAAKLCVECYKKERKLGIPSRDKLKELIYEYSFIYIGQLYGLSDNAVRKWCKQYNLPYQKNKIKKYTEQEWVDI